MRFRAYPTHLCGGTSTFVLFEMTKLIYSQIKSRWADERQRLFRSHLDFYFFGLLLFDLIQAVGGMMDIKWVRQSVGVSCEFVFFLIIEFQCRVSPKVHTVRPKESLSK